MPYKDPEKFRAYHAAYQRAHAAEHVASQRAYLQRQDAESPEAIEERNAARRVYWAEHAAEIGERRRALRQDNAEYAAQHAAHQRSYRQAHPEYRRADRARRRQRVTVIFTATDRAESVAWRELIRDDPCYYCGTAKTHHVDHYVALINGGTDHWWNLVRACQGCNLRKSAMDGDQFIALLASEGVPPIQRG